MPCACPTANGREEIFTPQRSSRINRLTRSIRDARLRADMHVDDRREGLSSCDKHARQLWRGKIPWLPVFWNHDQTDRRHHGKPTADEKRGRSAVPIPQEPGKEACRKRRYAQRGIENSVSRPT